MRLGQLARKLALRPSEIIDFLAQQQIQIETGGNTRLEDHHVALIKQKFAAHWIEEEENAPETDAPETLSSETPTDIKVNSPIPEANTSPESEFTEETKIEVIKAPKVELSGLKVLGKIDLPDTKKKLSAPAETLPEDAMEGSQQPRPEPRKPYSQRKEVRPQPRKNPIALQREREAAEAAEKRRAEIEREKEKRAQYYRKKVKVAPPTKRISLVEEPVEEFSAAELVEPPRTWWGKFIKWLNT